MRKRSNSNTAPNSSLQMANQIKSPIKGEQSIKDDQDNSVEREKHSASHLNEPNTKEVKNLESRTEGGETPS